MASSTGRACGAPAVRERASLTERAGAIVAILSLAAGLAVLALNAALRIGAVALALAGLLACVTASWYVVARRGLIRTLAAIAAVLAFGALVAGLVLTVISWWIVLAVAGLAVISVLSARYALRRTPKAIRSARRLQGDANRPGRDGAGADHQPQVRRRQGRAVRAGGRVRRARHQADHPAAGR